MKKGILPSFALATMLLAMQYANAQLNVGSTSAPTTGNALQVTTGGTKGVSIGYPSNAGPVDGAIIKGSVGIGTTTPAASSALQISSTNKGILIPQVTLTGMSDNTTVASPATGLMVYNTATAGTDPTKVTPGYYFYNGTQWAAMVSTTNSSVAVSHAGEIMRLSLSGQTYSSGSDQPLRLWTSLGNTPDGSATNFQNTITGASVNMGVTVAAGTGTPARTTDQLVLPAGTYQIVVYVDGSIQPSTLYVKTAVNNIEYTYHDVFVNTGTGTYAPPFGKAMIDFLVLGGATNTVDFLIGVGATLNTSTGAGIGSGTSLRSVVLLQRLK